MSVVNEQVKQSISSILGLDESEVTSESRFIEDLGADSLDIVEIVMDVEEKFDIEIDDQDVDPIRTVQDLMACVESKTK